MDYYEIEGKRLFMKYGVPTDGGVLYSGPESLKDVRFPCAVKIQTLSGKRGKAGGVRFAENREELEEAVSAVEKVTVQGKRAAGIYVTDKLDIRSEHYLAVTLDRSRRSVLVIYSPFGGMDIETLAEDSPEKLCIFPEGTAFDREAFVKAASPLQSDGELLEKVADIAERLFAMYIALDATTVEINPLAQLKNGELTAADAKLSIDDNALFRQGDYTLLPREREESNREREARTHGLAYVELDKNGGLGVIAGGAGIGMATVDTIKFYGGRPFNFMDLGGGVTTQKTYMALKLLLENPGVEGVLINVFGGINNCREMAEGICGAIRDTGSKTPVVVKSRGFYQEEGWRLYDELGLGQVRYGTTDDAVKLLLREVER